MANDRKVSQSLQDYAAKFRVLVTIERYGIYGDEWDYVAQPANPSHYPNVKPARLPVGNCGAAEMAIRMVAERMGTGKHTTRGFVAA